MVFGVCYVLIETHGLLTPDPLHTLATGLIAGFFIAIVAPTIVAALQSLSLDRSSVENKTLYVGNLPFRTTRYELRELFQPFGKIHSARIVIDRATRKPRGYGFVEMDSKGAIKAMNSLNGHSLAGRNLKVTEANDRE